MISGNEQQTRDALAEDERRQAERMAQFAVASGELSMLVTRRTALSKVQTQAHKDVTSVASDHEALCKHLYDALIDGDETDLVIAATSIQSSAAQVELAVGKLKRVTEDRLPVANIEVLKCEKAIKALALDLKIVEGRILNSKLLLAAGPASAVGGNLTIKSEAAARFGLEEAQLSDELRQASEALQSEIERQEKIRDARARPSGPVSWVNPS
jgi:hypothetical protein